MIVFVFPGQGSQRPGMGQALVERFPTASAVFDEVSEATGLDLRELCFRTDEDTLRQTQNAQIALYTAGVAAAAAMQEAAPHVVPGAFAGHSVGEYTALAVAGAVSVPDGARLVQRRGELMAASGLERPGTMAAILGLERDALSDVCASVPAEHGVAVIANDNCPGQLVISGDVAAVHDAGERAKAAGAKRVMPLNVSGAFHSPLMEGPSHAMGEALRKVGWHAPTAPVIANVTAEPVTTAEPWPQLLEQQLRAPVRWTESVLALAALEATHQIELGAGDVLTKLVKRIVGEIEAVAVHDPETLATAVDRLAEVME